MKNYKRQYTQSLWKAVKEKNNLNLCHDNDLYIINIVYKHYTSQR